MQPRTTKWTMGITLRAALVSWLITVVALFIFAAAMIPLQKQTFLENLESKARSVAVSLGDVAAGAVVNADYASVVDHCKEMLHGDRTLDYLVITRNDGFSLFSDREGWRAEPEASGEWRPSKRVPQSGIGLVPLFGRRVHYSQPFDYTGIQWGWIHVGLSTASYERSVTAIYRRTAILAVICIALSLAISVYHAKRLVGPILLLREVVEKVAGGDLSARAWIDRGDELGSLSNSINAMTEALLRRDSILIEAKETLEQRVSERTKELQEQVTAKERAAAELAQAQHQLVAASRQAGMAEVATGVLHNVGNVLNSVNVSVNLISDRLRRPVSRNLEKVASLMAEHRPDLGAFLTTDSKGRLVPEYLDKLATLLKEERTQLLSETHSLVRSVEHIKEIVAMQQSYARVAGVVEDLPAANLVEDALRIQADTLAQNGVTIEREFNQVPLVRVDKHKVLQILVNLLRNAKQALVTAERADKRLQVRVGMNGSGRVKIVIHDNGVGIPTENLTRIFQHGFTTKSNGHGFGLHSGALAAQEMGGSLQAASEGCGAGATFTLELPVAVMERN